MSKVVVVGGGIIGLTSALALLEQGFSHVHIVAKSFDDTTSHLAGALWMPFAMAPGQNTYRPRKWCEDSMNWLQKLWREHGDAAGIHELDGYELFESGTPDVVHPYWAHVVKDFRLLDQAQVKEICPDAAHGFAFRTIIYTPKTLMDLLHQKIKKLGGTFEERTVESLDYIKNADIVVNCTGIAAREVVSDSTVFPIRGQTIKIFNPKIKRFISLIGGETHTYILPRPNGEIVVGGTAQDNNWSVESDQKDVSGIWERASRLMPEIRGSKLIGPAAGLRPQRTHGVRLEIDPLRTSSGAVVIHNYGHSGSGHTLQWGCALDVVRLAKQHATENSSRL